MSVMMSCLGFKLDKLRKQDDLEIGGFSDSETFETDESNYF